MSSLEALGIMVVVSGGLGWLVAGRSLRPIRAITATAQRASENNLHERVALHGPDDELKELADTFDGLMTRLDSAFTAQRRFVANVSHELRTPLAIMRTAIDVTLAKPDRTPAQLEAMADKVRAASERTERLVRGLRDLARSDRGVESREAVDLATVAEDALDLFATEAGAQGIKITSDLAPASTKGDPALLERLVENLIENAIRHNAPEGTVEISTYSTDNHAVVSVANTGSLIDEAEVSSLFEPFRRKTATRTDGDQGVGLGLSIVASVAAAHAGCVAAQPRRDGGLSVTVTLAGHPNDESFRLPVAPRSGHD